MQEPEKNELLIAARTAANLTQQALATAMNVAKDTVSRWELGKMPIPKRKLDLYLQVCQFDIANAPLSVRVQAQPKGYDHLGFPVGWVSGAFAEYDTFDMKHFPRSRDVEAYILKLVEGATYPKRQAYRNSVAPPKPVEPTAAEKKAVEYATQWEQCRIVQAQKDAAAELADPGGVKRAAIEKTREEAEARKQEADYKDFMVGGDEIRREAEKLRVANRAAKLVAAEEEEARFRADRKAEREAFQAKQARVPTEDDDLC